MTIPGRVNPRTNSPLYKSFSKNVAGRSIDALRKANPIFSTIFNPVINAIKKVKTSNSPLAGALSRLGSNR